MVFFSVNFPARSFIFRDLTYILPLTLTFVNFAFTNFFKNLIANVEGLPYSVLTPPRQVKNKKYIITVCTCMYIIHHIYYFFCNNRYWSVYTIATCRGTATVTRTLDNCPTGCLRASNTWCCCYCYYFRLTPFYS